MACTTILVGKKASYDGSTMIARNDDSPSGDLPQRNMWWFTLMNSPANTYLSFPMWKSTFRTIRCVIPLYPTPLKAMVSGAASGVNEANVAMTATETITSNPRVLGADPLVVYQPGQRQGQEEIKGGIGEEDIVCLVLPYIHSAREGVKRLGSLLEQYGTYEMNGIAFQDAEEIWWLETIGGHHWMARKVPDDVYVIMPNQLGIDQFNLEDAFPSRKNICVLPI